MVGISRHYCSTQAQKFNSSAIVQWRNVCPTIGNILLAAVNFYSMYKITIYYGDNGCHFETEMPKIPNKEDKIGFWIDGDWTVEDIDYIVYEFDNKGKYIGAEISCVVR